MTALISGASHRLMQTLTAARNTAYYQGRTYSIEFRPSFYRTIRFNDGTYIGQVDDKGQPEGEGKSMNPRGMFEGTWKQGKLVSGTHTCEDGKKIMVRDKTTSRAEL